MFRLWAKLYENQEFSQYDNAVNSSVVEDTEYEQQYEYIPAKVLNNSINKIQNFIVINKGWKQGIQKNMAVICPTGIVGVALLLLSCTEVAFSLICCAC